MNLLLLGGSGFLSGTLARVALAQGHRVTIVNRGNKPLPPGVTPIKADRKDAPAFESAIRAAAQHWDLVVDCIGFNADDARQDVAVFASLANQLVFISTDFVLDPVNRPWCVDETYNRFDTLPYGAGKRAAEEVLLRQGALHATIIRPNHIYGPGSLLGCIPAHGRDAKLIDRIRAGETLRLVGGGHFLQQPVFAEDLARLILSCHANPRTRAQIYAAPGPDTIESRVFYQLIAQHLGKSVMFDEIPISAHLKEHPDHRPFCCHRVYSIDKARSHGLSLPTTALAEGLRQHVASILGA